MALSLYPVSDLLASVNRRSFLIQSSSLAVAAFSASCAVGPVKRVVTFPNYPFQLGVASGDPSPDGMVLWTRLAPKPLEGGGMPGEPIEVAWQVAEDSQFKKIVRKGKTFARPEWAHSVHVELSGLKPDRWYWYQFKAGSEVSPIGRTRTMPPLTSNPAQLRFVFASCQHYEAGLFTAFEHMLKEDADLVLHLGDYIYEGPANEKAMRKHVGPKLDSLESFRNRHAQYKTDPALQMMHAAVPWIVTWDDHEFENNCAGDHSERKGVTKEDFLNLRARAYQAYYEHMPLRRAQLPHGPDLLLYRRIPFGTLADFFVLDTRQYRTPQPCGDGTKAPCDEVYSQTATMFGNQQRDWLFKGLSKSRSSWNVLAQQVMMARVDRKAGNEINYSMDQWPGYETERRRVLKFLGERKIKNPITVAGDIHSNWANELITDFDQPDSKTVATEFVGTSITSGGDGSANPADLPAVYSENPMVKFHNRQRGYVRCDVSPKEWRAHFRTLDYVTKSGSPISTRASFVVESGRPQLQKT